jgi:hypothetical protein
VDYKFQINLLGIIELLSNHLYSGPEVFLRELLQNGVDAIRARLNLEPAHQGEKHLEWAVDAKDLYWRWKFYLAAHFLMSRVAANGQTSLKLRLPKAAPCFQEEGRYEVAALSAWIEGTCRELAERFDARNGNDGFKRRLAANRRLSRWLKPYPLRRSSKG